MRRRSKKNKYSLLLVLVIAIGFSLYELITPTLATNEIITNDIKDYNLASHYIDVGQGDAIFIELPDNRTMLIDAGEKENSTKIINYITSLGYSKLDYVIATHPHTDHIGALSDIIKEFDIGTIYMPKAVSTSKTYENLLTTIEDKGLSIKTGKSGVNIINEDDLKIDIIAPNKDEYSDLNNYSICLKITYKDISFLYMGDAETLSEEEITTDVNADIIKVGHHGSDTSSSIDFINRVKPKYAIISVGEGNSYGHPKEEIINRYQEIGAEIYRTDESGTIVIKTDGEKISITTEK